MRQHDQYEELCALAASGQIATNDLKDLKEHLHGCAECEELLSSFGQLAAQVLPEFANKHVPIRVPKGMELRFKARAHSEGIPLGAKKSDRFGLRRRALEGCVYAAAGAVAAALLIFICIHIFMPPSRSAQTQSPVAPSSAATSDDLLHSNRDLARKLQILRTRLSQVETQVTSERRALESAHLEEAQTVTRLADFEQKNGELRRNVADRDAQVAHLNAEAARLKNELDKLSSAKAAAELVIQAKQSKLADLQSKVDSLTVALDESQQLSAAANQAKELIVARNLHIVDVDDTDGSGRRQRPFGRIFYTEGKNLVFYAYDLSDSPKRNKEMNFYAWGSREGVNKSIKSLGIFHNDDANAGRWVLKFDDANVLAQINCVFVTVESGKKAVTQPTGKQILFASLGKPNHP